jgi:hypothetical protein
MSVDWAQYCGIYELEIVTMNSFTDKSLQNTDVLQNIGAIDRTARFFIGFVMIGPMFFYEIETVNIWLAMSALLGIFPVLSGIVGWCPAYAIFGTRSCGTDEHNACGTLPFQFGRLFRLSHH